MRGKRKRKGKGKGAGGGVRLVVWNKHLPFLLASLLLFRQSRESPSPRATDTCAISF